MTKSMSRAPRLLQWLGSKQSVASCQWTWLPMDTVGQSWVTVRVVASKWEHKARVKQQHDQAGVKLKFSKMEVNSTLVLAKAYCAFSYKGMKAHADTRICLQHETNFDNTVKIRVRFIIKHVSWQDRFSSPHTHKTLLDEITLMKTEDWMEHIFSITFISSISLLTCKSRHPHYKQSHCKACEREVNDSGNWEPPEVLWRAASHTTPQCIHYLHNKTVQLTFWWLNALCLWLADRAGIQKSAYY